MAIRKFIAPVITWAIFTAVFIVLLLTLGKNWRGVGHAFVPANIIALAFTGLIFFVIWAFKSQFGGRHKIAVQAAAVLKERYLGEYMERGELGEPRVIPGGTLRYSGSIKGVPVEMDFFTAPLRMPVVENDINSLKLNMLISLAQIRLRPAEQALTKDLVERAKAALPFVDTDYNIALKKFYNTSYIALTDDAGEDKLSPERFREYLNGLAEIAGRH